MTIVDRDFDLVLEASAYHQSKTDPTVIAMLHDVCGDMRVDHATHDECCGSDLAKRVVIMRRCVLAHHNATPWWRAS